MKKVILAFDSFKGSVDSMTIAQITADAVRKQYPACQVITFPVADGGEGTTKAICSALPVTETVCMVHNPLMIPMEVSYAITADGSTAIFEMASCCGLPLLNPEDRNPIRTDRKSVV